MGVEVILSLQTLSPTKPARNLRASSASSSTLRLGLSLLLSRSRSLDRYHGQKPPKGASSPLRMHEHHQTLRASASFHAFSGPGHNPGSEPESRKLLESFLDRKGLSHGDEQRWRDRDRPDMDSFSITEGCPGSTDVHDTDIQSKARWASGSGSGSRQIDGINLAQPSSVSCPSSSGLPFSLRMLKRKQRCTGRIINKEQFASPQGSSLVSGINRIGNSLINAFSSMVFMVRTLQSHTLQIHQQFCQQDIEGLLSQVHRDMHASFLWLFQQVFSCTPQLMVLLMILLADFTVFSVSNNLPMSISASNLHNPVSLIGAQSTALTSDTDDCYTYKSLDSADRYTYKSFAPSTSPSLNIETTCQHEDSGWIGNDGGGGKVGRPRVAGDADGDPDSKLLSNMNTASASAGYTMDDKFSIDRSPPMLQSSIAPNFGKLGASNGAHSMSEEDISLADSELSDSMEAAAHALDELRSAEYNDADERVQVFAQSKEMDVLLTSRHLNHVTLDRETMKMFVAPVTVQAEDDNYSCYDRTDLAYQFAIGKDSTNSMLLANYAQFLFLVRKDHDRAEELFRRAVQCDPSDGTAITCFASFLWLARHNLQGADKAYRAAISSDPGNSFYAANYAFFLWTSAASPELTSF